MMRLVPLSPGVVGVYHGSEGMPPLWSAPESLPASVVLAGGGAVATAELSAAELSGMGFLPADDAPAYNAATQHAPLWSSEMGTWTVAAKTADELSAEAMSALAAAVQAVEAEASRRILAIAPEWKQLNLIARAAELALLYPGARGADLPEPERTEYLAGQAVWERSRAIRDASNRIEALLAAAASGEGTTAADALAVDITAGWPA